jgi:hypothetical protein
LKIILKNNKIKLLVRWTASSMDNLSPSKVYECNWYHRDCARIRTQLLVGNTYTVEIIHSFAKKSTSTLHFSPPSLGLAQWATLNLRLIISVLHNVRDKPILPHVKSLLPQLNNTKLWLFHTLSFLIFFKCTTQALQYALSYSDHHYCSQ